MAYRGFGVVFFAATWIFVGFATACGPKSKPAKPGEAIESPPGPLSQEQALDHLLHVINRDRASEGLSAVEHDAVASRAALRHAQDMVRHGFTAHWGTDGSVPEQRYTEAGGQHMVLENAACFFDGERREVDPDAVFSARDVEQIQKAFMDEVPPHDGHRRNILKPWHTHVGLAVVKPVGVPQACLVQEFTDQHGDFEPLPARAKLGQLVRVGGVVNAPVEFGAVGIGRIDHARPIAVADLHKTSSYQIPDAQTLYAPAGYETPKPVHVEGRRFYIDVPLNVGNKPGRYLVSVWGQYPGESSLAMISLRTVLVH